MPAQTKNPARLPIRRERRSLIMGEEPTTQRLLRYPRPVVARSWRPRPFDRSPERGVRAGAIRGPGDIKMALGRGCAPRHLGRQELRPRFARREDLGLTRAEFAVLRRLSGPEKIQDFLHALTANF